MAEITNHEEADGDAVPLATAVGALGNDVTVANLLARIKRGSLAAYQNESGEWYIPTSEIERVLAAVEPCRGCANPATSVVVVKYHFHDRVEFTLCPACARKAHAAYGKQKGVLEVVVYPLLGEGWLAPPS